MAIDPVTTKIITRVALKMATDEEMRKKIVTIALIIIISVLLILTMFVYIVINPLEQLGTLFSGNELIQATQLHDQFPLNQNTNENDKDKNDSEGCE